MSNGVKLFYSYSSKDEAYRSQLEAHLAILRRRGIVDSWDFRKIVPGQDWDREIHAAIEDADLFLILVSSDFMASDYCYDIELKAALERRRKGISEVIPIMLRPVDTEGAPFHKLQALPTDRKPVSRWEDVDEAWLSVAKGIRLVCENFEKLEGEGAPDSEAPEVISITEEDFGLLDFIVEFDNAMALAIESQERLSDHMQATNASMNEKTERVRGLAGQPDSTRQARRIAGSMAADLSSYAGHAEGVASELRDAWSRVDRYFPGLMEHTGKVDENMDADLPALLASLHEARDGVQGLRSMIVETSESLSPLGTFAASLKVGVGRAQRALGTLLDAYWEIENSINQMITRVEAWMEE